VGAMFDGFIQQSVNQCGAYYLRLVSNDLWNSISDDDTNDFSREFD
jgi:hypothetical protein